MGHVFHGLRDICGRSDRMIILTGPLARKAACQRVMEAPENWVVRITERTRSLDQNAKLWACLTDLAEQVEWYGTKLSAENWKDVLTASLKRNKVVPGLDGGFVVLGQHTSKMTKAEFSELLELCMAFGAEHEVVWSEEIAA